MMGALTLKNIGNFMFKSASFINYAGLLTMAVLWGSVFATIVIALQSFDPLAIAWWRTVIAALFLWLGMVLFKKPLIKDWSIWRQLTVISIFMLALPYIFISHAGLYTNSSTMGLCMSTMPLFALILSHYLKMMSNVYWYNYLGVGIGFMGMYLLFSGGEESIDLKNSTGVILATMTAICYAIAAVLNKRMAGKVDMENLITIPYITGGILLLPVVWLTGADLWPEHPSQNSIIALVYMAILPTAVAGIVRIIILLRTNPAFISLSTYIIPIVSTLIGVMFMNDVLQQNFWTAIVLVMAGIILCQYRR